MICWKQHRGADTECSACRDTIPAGEPIHTIVGEELDLQFCTPCRGWADEIALDAERQYEEQTTEEAEGFDTGNPVA